MHILECTLPDGSVISRKTCRAYTHVVCVKVAVRWTGFRWTRIPEKALRETRRDLQAQPDLEFTLVQTIKRIMSAR